MKRYKIYHSNRFEMELSKLDKSLQNRIDKIEDQLVKNPYVGSPLNVKWFREKRIEKYRIYYVIYEDLESAFMVAISEKKDQQKVINTIRLLFDFFREEIESLID
ncbi:MAG TPA: hypothetical protein ENG87_02385 [Candidatus Pacearchaeota archaeon]|nr:hypothetical protein BMS3Abin17_00774 [archaeon BMS3Abin17]HDK42203.1 hypothetical protein [Candidatus Pacearchaeota archaeon]HDZ61460.1 hypothetical protein [Candidatus Pacearchaeota archaeon]